MTNEDLCKLQEMVRSQDKTARLWAQGDLLRDHPLPTSDLEVVAASVGLKLKTLQEREHISREFPPSVRDTRHAWSVYKELSNIPGDDERMKVLNSQNEWTVEQMQRAVRNWKMQHGTLRRRVIW